MKPEFKITHASKIKQNILKNDEIREHIQNILNSIDDDIHKTVEALEKTNYAVSEIPSNFNVSFMTNNEAQMQIYYGVLRALKKNGYTPKIEFKGSPQNRRVLIHLTWFTPEDIEEKKYMNDFIKSCSLNSEEEKPIRRRRRKTRS